MKKNTSCNKERSWKRASDLLLMAFNSEGNVRNTLARKAININHDYVDAYVFLGDEASNPLEREKWYRMAVAVGRRVLGLEFFEKHYGEFWQIPKTRPFMDGLQGLADELMHQDREEEALSYYQELLHLNTNDDQGARYSIFKILIKRELYVEARELFNLFSADNSSGWLYNDVLLTYLESEDKGNAKEKLLKALDSNSLICELILNPPAGTNIEQYDISLVYEEAESFDYVISMVHLWSEESGILEWMNSIYEKKIDFKLKPPRAGEKSIILATEGRSLLEQGDLAEAHRLFELALEYQEDLYIRNDLGYCKLLLEQYQAAIDVLRPALDRDILNPYGNCLATEAAYQMGDEVNARRFLKQAISQFEQGIQGPLVASDYPDGLTIILKDLAGLLGNHKLVLSLYRRWKKYCDLDEDLFQVGVAYFNLGNYKAAINYWKRIVSKDAWFLLKDYITAAKIFEKNDFPSLSLEYLTPFHLVAKYQFSHHQLGEMVDELEAVKLLIIAKLFEDPSIDHVQKIRSVQVLCSLGQWGIDFGKSLLKSAKIPYLWKIATIFCLLSEGYYSYGDIVPVVVDGILRNLEVNESLFEDLPLSDENYVLKSFAILK